jgi:hypothetical protein
MTVTMPEWKTRSVGWRAHEWTKKLEYRPYDIASRYDGRGEELSVMLGSFEVFGNKER